MRAVAIVVPVEPRSSIIPRIQLVPITNLQIFVKHRIQNADAHCSKVDKRRSQSIRTEYGLWGTETRHTTSVVAWSRAHVSFAIVQYHSSCIFSADYKSVVFIHTYFDADHPGCYVISGLSADSANNYPSSNIA